MNQPHDTESVESGGHSTDLRDVSKWARVYAQSRSLPFLVSMVLFVLLFLAIAGPSYLGGKAYRDGNMVLFVACITVLVPATAALIYFSVPWWGGKRMERFAKRLYAKEGNVAMSPEKTAYSPRVAGLLMGGFLLCVLASVVLDMFGYISEQYMQPVSALYLVPFVVILTFMMRPAVGLGPLLWPALYGLHAILIVAGAPIQFTGRWNGLNILLPVAGYGILAGLVGHVYNRFALRRLKRVARSGLAGSDEPKEAHG